MARAPKPLPKGPAPKVSYFILDKTATAIGGQKIKVDQKEIELTEAEASFYLASGAISTAEPASDDAVAAAHAARNEPAAKEPPPPPQPSDEGSQADKGAAA